MDSAIEGEDFLDLYAGEPLSDNEDSSMDEAVDGDGAVDKDKALDEDEAVDGDKAVYGEDHLDLYPGSPMSDAEDSSMDEDKAVDKDKAVDEDEAVDGNEAVDEDKAVDGEDHLDLYPGSPMSDAEDLFSQPLSPQKNLPEDFPDKVTPAQMDTDEKKAFSIKYKQEIAADEPVTNKSYVNDVSESLEKQIVDPLIATFTGKRTANDAELTENKMAVVVKTEKTSDVVKTTVGSATTKQPNKKPEIQYDLSQYYVLGENVLPADLTKKFTSSYCTLCNKPVTQMGRLCHYRAKQHAKNVMDYLDIYNKQMDLPPPIPLDGKAPVSTKEVKVFFCQLCKMYCGSERLLEQHNRGRKHERNLLMVKYPLGIPSQPPFSFTCEVCDIVLTSERAKDGHLGGQKHAKAVRKKEREKNMEEENKRRAEERKKREEEYKERLTLKFTEIKPLRRDDWQSDPVNEKRRNNAHYNSNFDDNEVSSHNPNRKLGSNVDRPRDLIEDESENRNKRDDFAHRDRPGRFRSGDDWDNTTGRGFEKSSEQFRSRTFGKRDNRGPKTLLPGRTNVSSLPGRTNKTSLPGRFNPDEVSETSFDDDFSGPKSKRHRGVEEDKAFLRSGDFGESRGWQYDRKRDRGRKRGRRFEQSPPKESGSQSNMFLLDFSSSAQDTESSSNRRSTGYDGNAMFSRRPQIQKTMSDKSFETDTGQPSFSRRPQIQNTMSDKSFAMETDTGQPSFSRRPQIQNTMSDKSFAMETDTGQPSFSRRPQMQNTMSDKSLEIETDTGQPSFSKRPEIQKSMPDKSLETETDTGQLNVQPDGEKDVPDRPPEKDVTDRPPEKDVTDKLPEAETDNIQPPEIPDKQNPLSQNNLELQEDTFNKTSAAEKDESKEPKIPDTQDPLHQSSPSDVFRKSSESQEEISNKPPDAVKDEPKQLKSLFYRR